MAAAKKKVQPNQVMGILREKAAKMDGGHDIIMHMKNIFNDVSVLPLEHTALQYLLGITGLPYGRAITLVGPPGTGKSAMAHYLSSLVLREENGIYGFVDAEQKTNMEQVQGIMHNSLDGDMRRFVDHFLPFVVESFEEMMEKQVWIGNQMVELHQNGVVFPWVITTDSLSFLMNEAYKDKVAEGEIATPGYSHMHKANALQTFLGSFIPAYVNNYPGIFLAVNHQKEKTEKKGQIDVKTTNEAGGIFKDFLWSYNIEFRKGTWLDHNMGMKRQGITLKTKKSTGSENGRKIGVGMLTRQRTDHEGQVVGIDVEFDFDTTLAEMVAGAPKWDKHAKPFVSDEYRQSIGFVKVTAAKMSCKALNLKEVSPKEMGAALEHKVQTDKAFGDALRKELWIFDRPEFDFKNWEAPSTKKMKVEDVRKQFPADGSLPIYDPSAHVKQAEE